MDFYHHASGLVLEIDGDSHAERGKLDRERQAWLESRKLRVLRFSNDDVLHDLENVLEAVVSALTGRPAIDRPLAGDEGQPGRRGKRAKAAGRWEERALTRPMATLYRWEMVL